MAVNTNRARQYLQAGELTELFVEELGWDRIRARPQEVQADGATFMLEAVAEKRGMVVYRCTAGAGSPFPDYATRQQIERQVVRWSHEHIVVYVDAGGAHQLWQWVRREPGNPLAYREHRYADFARLASSHWARQVDPSPRMAGLDLDRTSLRTGSGEASALPAGRRLR